MKQRAIVEFVELQEVSRGDFKERVLYLKVNGTTTTFHYPIWNPNGLWDLDREDVIETFEKVAKYLTGLVFTTVEDFLPKMDESIFLFCNLARMGAERVEKTKEPKIVTDKINRISVTEGHTLQDKTRRILTFYTESGQYDLHIKEDEKEGMWDLSLENYNKILNSVFKLVGPNISTPNPVFLGSVRSLLRSYAPWASHKFSREKTILGSDAKVESVEYWYERDSNEPSKEKCVGYVAYLFLGEEENPLKVRIRAKLPKPASLETFLAILERILKRLEEKSFSSEEKLEERIRIELESYFV